MNEVYQLPPILQGTAEQQLRQLRDYLVRLSRQLPAQGNAQETAVIVQRAVNAAKPKDADAIAAAQARARQLKDLIVKTADEVYASIDKISTYLSYDYRAESEYGTYLEQIQTSIEQTAKETVESYEYGAAIEAAASGAADALEEYRQTINGQIRRGIIVDPSTQNETLGIVISQDLSFTGRTKDVGGETYYYLEPGQTVGIYTSTGWQYWIGGAKVGWFDSKDSMLHVANLLVEDQLQFSSDWLVTTEGGWGLRYIGG